MRVADRAALLATDDNRTTDDETISADATSDASTDTGWRIAEPSRPSVDSLLDCLVDLACLLERPCSADAMVAGLPLEDEQLTPELAVRAAARAGLAARITKRPLERIATPTLPCILLLKNREACILVERRPGGRMIVAMPESGQGAIELGEAELAKRYIGHALFAKPVLSLNRTGKIDKGSDSRHWFLAPLIASWPIYAEVLLAALLINLFALASPLFIMNVYDRVVPNQALETLWALSLGVIIVFLFDFILRTLRGYFVDSAGKIADIKLAGRIFEQVLGIKMALRPSSSGAFANNLREFESLRDFFTSATLVAVIDLPFIVLFVAIVWLIGGPIALVPALAIPIVLGSGLLLQWPLQRVMREAFVEAAQKHGLLVESINGLETIKSLGAEGRIQRSFEHLTTVTARSATKARFFGSIGVHVAGLSQNLATVGVVIYGVHRIGEGLMTVGALVACTIITGRAMAPLAQVAGMLTRYHQARSAFKALDQVMKLDIERPPGASFLHRPTLKGDVEFNAVTFAYPDQKIRALDHVSFKIKAGERVGLIGKVGSGKTTIEKLLLGLFEPDEGTILIDGTDLRQIDPADLRRNIGAVMQDVMLFHGSVKHNITLGSPFARDDSVLRAAQIAGVDSFTARHPQGFDLPVGERGDRLSGGQRQAIAVARAMLNDPPILLLDEPTSAMDNAAEGLLKARLAEIAAERTLILVTHRTSLLSLVDRLIVLDAGRVVADGSKDDVLRALSSGQVKASP